MAKELTYKQYKQQVEEQAQAMLDTMTVVAEGDMEVKVDVPQGIDVLSDLALGFSRLVADMRQLVAEQQRTKSELEERVAMRTRALELALEDVQAMQSRYLQQEWTRYTSDFDPISQQIDDTEAEVFPEKWLSSLAQAVEQKNMVVDTAGHHNLVVPLSYSDEIIGVLGFDRPETTQWSEEDLAAVEAIAVQVGLALENQRLFDQTQAALTQTETLYDSSERVVRAETIDDVLLALVETTTIKQFDRANIVFFDEVWADTPPQGFTIAAVWERSGKSSAAPAGTHYSIEELTFFSLLKREGITFIRDMVTDERLDENTRTILVDQLGMCSLVIFPLIVGEQWIGFFTVQSSTLMDLSEDQLRQMNSLIGQAATVVQNQRLFEQSQQRATELEETTTFLDTIIDNIPTGLFVKDAQELRFVQWNKANELIIGLNKEAVLGKTDHDLYSKEMADAFAQDDHHVLDGGEAFDIPEEEIHTPHKGIRFLHTQKVPILGADGLPRYLLGLSEDITAQKEARAERERLLIEVQRLAAIVENHADFISTGTMTGQALYVNPAGLQMMGFPPDHEITDMDIARFYLPEDAQRLTQEGIPHALKVGSWSTEANLRRVDGTTMPVEQTVGINYDSEGNPFSFTITMRDIAKRKANEAERERLLAEVEAAYHQYVEREWSQFLGEQHQGLLHFEHNQSALTASDGNGLTMHPAVQNRLHALSDAPVPVSSLETPIALRGQAIGTFRLEDMDPNREWTQEELSLVEAVSEQLAQTVENLRLFDDTQLRAAREQLTREITEKMRAAPDVETIIETGLSELSQALNVSRSYVKLNPKFEAEEEKENN